VLNVDQEETALVYEIEPSEFIELHGCFLSTSTSSSTLQRGDQLQMMSLACQSRSLFKRSQLDQPGFPNKSKLLSKNLGLRRFFFCEDSAGHPVMRASYKFTQGLMNEKHEVVR
jgi:hypothetical protein